MVSGRNRYTKARLTETEIKIELAAIFTYARREVRDGFLDYNINTPSKGAEKLIEQVDDIIKGWFTDGGASKRTPKLWIGVPKTNLIMMFP